MIKTSYNNAAGRHVTENAAAERRVLARWGWAGEKSDVFIIRGERRRERGRR